MDGNEKRRAQREGMRCARRFPYLLNLRIYPLDVEVAPALCLTVLENGVISPIIGGITPFFVGKRLF
ncbi:hypothetical protein [Bifidobacterium cuniculi]|uniref:hypothetical protein n=1 Tax=Bifidobacterium cuniculi TaxID=1688 RepID=UPI001269B5B1|nr:hypothetical protein [Bifidobacterium cuniculi]